MPCDKACHFRTGRPFKKTHPAGIFIKPLMVNLVYCLINMCLYKSSIKTTTFQGVGNKLLNKNGFRGCLMSSSDRSSWI